MAKIDTYLKKIPADVAQIGVGALAGAAAMTAAEYLVAKPIAKSVKEYRLKLGELKAAGKTADATALEAKAPIGTKISATTIKDLTVLGVGLLAKATAPKNTYTEYATDGIIFFAVADLITRKIGVASFKSDF